MTVDPDVLYTALIGDPARLGALRRLAYRCATESRCLLLDAVGIPEPARILLHQKRYKLSQTWNAERSSEAGRAANTYDGANHWKPRTYYISSSALALVDAEGASLEVQCDHVSLPLTPSDFHGDWEAGHAEVRIRPDGSRFPVR